MNAADRDAGARWSAAVLRAIAAAIRARGACEIVPAAISPGDDDIDVADRDLRAWIALARDAFERFVGEAATESPDATESASLGEAYQRLLAHRPTRNDAGDWVLARHSRARKRSGSFYTPGSLVDRLLDVSLDPLVAETLARVAPSDRADALLSLRVLDPACGDGRLLRAAGVRLASRLAALRSPNERPSEADIRAARAAIASRCLCGLDRDPAAVLLATHALHADGANEPEARVVVGDAFDADPRSLDALAETRGGFDLVLGNPPFANAIEGDLPASIVARARASGSLLGGTADLASYFLELGLRLARPGGRVAMIQPRPTFVSPATEAFRAALRPGFRVNALYAPERSSLFRGALVFTGVVALGPDATCRVSRDPDPASVAWRETIVADAGWWDALWPHGRSAGDVGETLALDELCEVAASLTTGEAYELRAALVDEPTGSRLKLVTTGLIDPGRCFWGERVCRFLKRDFAHPRIDESRLTVASLRKRVANARRPKVLVAGLSKRVEAYCDATGECLGAVSTFAIFHPRDDRERLARLAAWLGSSAVDELFRRALSAGAVGGGDFVMTKRFLKSLPIPRSVMSADR